MSRQNTPSMRPPFLQSGDPATENRVAGGMGNYDGQLGMQFSFGNPANTDPQTFWQMVQLDSAVDVAPTAGAVAWWRDNTGYVVTTDVSVAGRGNIAGVFGGAVDVDNICCVQQKGPANVQVQTGPTAAPSDTGQFVIPSATDAKADWLAAGSAATYPPLGTSAGFASGGLARVDLNIEGRP